MRHVIVGSKNPAKVHAVQEVLIKEPFEVHSVDVPSLVSAQPFSDEETVTGAINRAKQALASADAAFSIGLEGGVYRQNGHLYLCNWGALVTPEQAIYTAGGLRMQLPTYMVEKLEQGYELSAALAANASKQEGAVGVLTNGRISRKEMFTHIVRACYGQYLVHQK